MTGHISSIGENIRKTGDSYNNFIGSMDRNFIPKATELGDFFPELDNKKTTKPKMVEGVIKSSVKIMQIKSKMDNNAK